LQPNQSRKLVSNKRSHVDLSIIIPTYNESENILHLLKSIKEKIPSPLFSEIIVVDDNSPDRTAELVEGYSQTLENDNIGFGEASSSKYKKLHGDSNLIGSGHTQFSVSVIHRDEDQSFATPTSNHYKILKQRRYRQ
jgi:dolichol-phosphate mannosyltransferase